MGTITLKAKIQHCTFHIKQDVVPCLNLGSKTIGMRLHINFNLFPFAFTYKYSFVWNFIGLHQVNGKPQPTSKNMSLMCAYKLCRVEFRYWGMQTKLEKYIHDTALRKTMVILNDNSIILEWQKM